MTRWDEDYENEHDDADGNEYGDEAHFGGILTFFEVIFMRSSLFGSILTFFDVISTR